jgi:hypothetical protein
MKRIKDRALRRNLLSNGKNNFEGREIGLS